MICSGDKMINNKQKILKRLNKIKIAHRGLWDESIPENSIGAFKRCVDKNIPIELDIHLLKDNTLVVFHDDNLKRMTGIDKLLKTATYSEIKDLKLKNTNYNIPTLKEVLDLVEGKVLLDIEIKTDVDNFNICHQLCNLLDVYKGDFIIKSFNPFYIWWFRLHRPNFIRGLLVSRLKSKKMNKLFKYALFKMWFNSIAKPDFISFNYRDLPNKKIEIFRKRGVPILLFTIKENEIMNYQNDYDGWLFEL